MRVGYDLVDQASNSMYKIKLNKIRPDVQEDDGDNVVIDRSTKSR